MKKQRVLALLLCLALLCTLIPGVFAANENASSTGMEISKTATANSDGTYTVTLEAYATGSKIISEVKKDIPTDIVLVLDQSGSMDDPIGTVSFQAYSTNQSKNSQHYNRRHNGGSANLWHKVGEKYYSVSVVKQETLDYEPLSTDLVNYDTSWGDLTTDCYYYYYYANNLYEKVGDEYKKVTLTYSGDWEGRNYVYTFTYTFSDGSTVTSKGRSTSPELGTHSPLYYSTVNDNLTKYTYTYTDANGDLQTIGTSTGANTTFSTPLYQRVVNTNAGDSRLNALKTAVTTFADSVAEKAKGEDGELGTEDDVNHRIAMVGFATGDYSNNDDYPTYENTELFIGATQYNYNVNANSYYGSAFQNMNTQAGYNNVIASKNALAARGATYVNYGMKMANSIFAANPLKEGEQRNRVVVVFTDGAPGYSSYSQTVAENAITEGNTAKKTYGATVYTVGVFSGADATSAGNKDSNDGTQKANWFMQNLSSNNGKVQTPSYYLSAGDADTLNNIFQQISNQIESGGSSSTLSEETVIKDIISPAFTLPEGATAANITLETYHCTGKSGEKFTFSETPNETAMGASAEVEGDQVNVTGFNFADNYVGTVTENSKVTYRGDKLVISFTVSPKDGFLGGNNVYTNASAGVYENSSAAEPVLTFEQPQVNVPIQNVTVTAADKNVYLLGGVTGAQLKAGATVKVGDVALDLSADNYGLEKWQTEYVDITVKYYDADGVTEITDLSNLTDDTTYTVEVTVAPKAAANATSSGTPAVAKSGSDSGDINVFKPTVTFKDSDVYYGAAAPTDFSGNKVSEVWKHGDTLSTAKDVTVLGNVPTVEYTYALEADAVSGGLIATRDDISVNVTPKIGSTDITDYTKFEHQKCSGKSCTPDSDYEFLLHVKTCSLTISKTGCVDIDENQSFIFKVTGGAIDVGTLTVTVQGNNSATIEGLPVGSYTVSEDSGWSWRYSCKDGSATVSVTTPDAEVEMKNKRDAQQWLSGSSYIVNNWADQSVTHDSKDPINK